MTFTESTNRLAKILSIISTNSFPKDASNLTHNQINQFRDAMIFESALIEGCNIVCSNDGRAFFNHGKQELLEQQFNIKLYKPCELLGAVNA
jgi:predicted nucleic acid-binding protein